MDWSFRENWDEYAWSQEIRKDEMRIAGYFRELPVYLDMPGEDNRIFESIMSQKELLPTGVSDLRDMLQEEFDSAEEEEGDENKLPNCQFKLSMSKQLARLSEQWALLTADKVGTEKSQYVLAVVCAFGKAISRLYNIEESEDDSENSALHIGLFKRLLADLNELVKLMEEFFDILDIPSQINKEFVDQIAEIRDQAIDRMNCLRTKI